MSKCSKCNKVECTVPVEEYSLKNFNKVLCFDCQKEENTTYDKPAPTKTFNKEAYGQGARIGMTIQVANRKVISENLGGGKDQWAVHVVEHAKALLDEMDKQELK